MGDGKRHKCAHEQILGQCHNTHLLQQRSSETVKHLYLSALCGVVVVVYLYGLQVTGHLMT